MKSTTRVAMIAVATVGLGVAGYALLAAGIAPPSIQVKPIPLSMDLGPIAVLQEPASSPYDALMEKAVRTAPGQSEQARAELLRKLRDLRARWKVAGEVASAAAPAAADRL